MTVGKSPFSIGGLSFIVKMVFGVRLRSPHEDGRGLSGVEVRRFDCYLVVLHLEAWRYADLYFGSDGDCCECGLI